MDIAPRQKIPVIVANASASDRERLATHRAAIDFLAGVESVDELPAAEIPESAVALVGDMQLRVPLAGLIDTEAELARLDKRLAKLEKDLNGVRGRLASDSFVSKAPAEVVDKARAQAEELEREQSGTDRAARPDRRAVGVRAPAATCLRGIRHHITINEESAGPELTRRAERG